MTNSNLRPAPLTINSGDSAAIAFGTWKLAREQASHVIQEALSVGYRRFDTAAAYANESEVGEGIATNEIAREELFISGKLWNSKRSYDAAIKACKRSLRNLGLTYFDQYLIHWPASPKLYENWQDINGEAWRALETLHSEGLAKRIGVCNFNVEHLSSLLPHARVKPMVNQIELHPGYAQPSVVEFCMRNGIALEAWSPLGNGQLLSNVLVLELAKKYGVAPAQICISWCLQIGALPISKSQLRTHMQECFASTTLHISKSDSTRLSSMETCAFSGMDPDEMTYFG